MSKMETPVGGGGLDNGPLKRIAFCDILSIFIFICYYDKSQAMSQVVEQLRNELQFKVESLPEKVDLESFALGRVMNRPYRCISDEAEFNLVVRPRAYEDNTKHIAIALVEAKVDLFIDDATEIEFEYWPVRSEGDVVEPQGTETGTLISASTYLGSIETDMVFLQYKKGLSEITHIIPDSTHGYFGVEEELYEMLSTKTKSRELRRAIKNYIIANRNRKNTNSSSTTENESLVFKKLKTCLKSRNLDTLPVDVLGVIGKQLETWRDYLSLKQVSRSMRAILSEFEDEIGWAIATSTYKFKFPPNVEVKSWNSFFMGVEKTWLCAYSEGHDTILYDNVCKWYKSDDEFAKMPLKYLSDTLISSFSEIHGVDFFSPELVTIDKVDFQEETDPIWEGNCYTITLPLYGVIGCVGVEDGKSYGAFCPLEDSPSEGLRKVQESIRLLYEGPGGSG